MTPVDSHVLTGYGYDAASQTMVLQFRSSKNSKEYEYPDTPPEKFAELAAAESKGSWWYSNKADFPNFRVMQDDAPADATNTSAEA
jgi:hypothetical protein